MKHFYFWVCGLCSVQDPSILIYLLIFFSLVGFRSSEHMFSHQVFLAILSILVENDGEESSLIVNQTLI